MEVSVTPIKHEDFPIIPGDSYNTSTRVHSGIYTSAKNCKLSEHFWLSTFARDGNYMFNEYLIEKLEAMFDNFTAIKGCEIASAYRTWQPGNYTSMHNLGGAVDIAWLDENGKKLDAKYIAPAAVCIGFGGVAPLEKPDGTGGFYANSLHMDVRIEQWGSYWYGYERDDVEPCGWFESHTISGTSKGKPDAFYKWYNITEADVLAYLGGTKPPTIYRTVVKEAGTTKCEFSAYIKTYSPITEIKYVLLSPTGDKIEKTLTKFESEEDSITFSVNNLVPGTDYVISIELTSGAGATKAAPLYFSTNQDFPKAGTVGELVIIGNSEKATPTCEYKATISIPSYYDCYWEQYWKNKGSAYKGYNIVIIANGEIVQVINNISSGSIRFKPTDLNISFGTNIQIGLQTWIHTDKKTNKSEYETIASDMVCSQPICLQSEIPLIRKLYIRDNDTYIQTMIAALKEDN